MPCKETECKCEFTKTELIADGHDKYGNCRNPKCDHPVGNHTDASTAGVDVLTEEVARRLQLQSPQRIRDSLQNSLVAPQTKGAEVYGHLPTLPMTLGLAGVGSPKKIKFPAAFKKDETETSKQVDLVTFTQRLSKKHFEAIDTSSHSEFGSAFDRDVLFIPFKWPRVFASVVVVGEMKTDLGSKQLLEQALGQVVDRISRLRNEQPLRKRFWGFVTDLTRIMFVEATLEDGLQIRRTALFPLFDPCRATEANGTTFLRGLLRMTPEALGICLPPIPKFADDKKLDLYVLSHKRKARYIVYKATFKGTDGILKVPLDSASDKMIMASRSLQIECANIQEIQKIFPVDAKVGCKLISLEAELEAGGHVQSLFFTPVLTPLSFIPSGHSRRIKASCSFVAEQILELHSVHGKIHGDLSANNIVTQIEDGKVAYAFPIDWATMTQIGAEIKQDTITLTPMFCSRSMLSVYLGKTSATAQPLDDAETLFSSMLFQLVRGNCDLFLERGEFSIELLLEKKKKFWNTDVAMSKAWYAERDLSELLGAHIALKTGNALKCLQDLKALACT